MDTVTGSTDIRVSDARMGGRPRESPRRHKMSRHFGLMPREWRALRADSRPVNLARFDRSHRGWMTSEDDLWWVAEHLVRVPHTRLLTVSMMRNLSRVDRRSLDAGLVGYREH